MTSFTHTAPVRQAVILAGGQGTRLRPFTDDRPKPMIEIAGKPIIDHQIEWLASEGVETVIVSCGHLAEVLQEHLASHDQPVDISTVVETEPLGRGGALKYAGKHLPTPSGPWYATNGDVWTRFSLRQMAAYHTERGATATLALARPRLPWGAVEVDQLGHIVDFAEAPRLPYPINGGIYVFGPDILDLLPDKGDHERTTFPQLAKQRRLAGFAIEGYWRAIDTHKDIQEAAKELEGYLNK
ncbi:nucleotidyltransferase family protein [Actinoallomurus purpureus]|uniref:nucleotidyltransferase family protein n=1 Tax=Actinoallomurus purpureus TaxID=478114 RepID=UPI002093F310|nr:nucleotidyltransferase family protein [Actinoallomurus purpureus]MCO6008906.1 nucleotidyltransferase family protein [Actinoallomurus purpureus]